MGGSVHAERKPEAKRKVHSNRSPLEKRMHSPLYFGSGALSFWGDGSCAAYGIHTVLPGPLQAGHRRRKGAPILHQKGVAFTKGGNALIPLESRLLELLVLSLLLPL